VFDLKCNEIEHKCIRMQKALIAITRLQTDADALPLPILIRIRDWARTPDVTLPEYARSLRNHHVLQAVAEGLL
jgi:hypothetical protein